MKTFLRIACFWALSGCIVASAAIIEAINLEIYGTQSINPDAALAHIALKEGMEFSPLLVDQSVRSLYASGAYDFVEARVQVDPDGEKLRLIFVLVTKYRVQSATFEGNNRIKTSKLQKKVKTHVGDLLSEADVKIDAETLTQYYEKEGFPNAKVTYHIDKQPDQGEACVTFHIDEGQKLKLVGIDFQGNHHIKKSKLLDVMKTKSWWIFSWLDDSGMLEDYQLSEGIDRLTAFYKDQGYLDVDIPLNEIIYTYPKNNQQIKMTINIHEGRCYHVESIQIEGHTLYSEAVLKKVIGIQPGEVFSPSAIQDALEAIRDFYGQSGYLETTAHVLRTPNFETGGIALTFSIQESPKFYVETILLEGNTKTKSNVILRELALAPGDTFDLVRMKASEQRLKNTLFFEEVDLTPESVPVPNHRNLRVTVKEKHTGNIQFGVGFGSVEQAVAFVELTQSNFDIKNYRNYFQGAGQKLRIRLSVGNKSNSMFLNFEEPAVYDRELAAGFDLFRNDAKYVSSLYDELRYGTELYVRKRLYELFVIRPYYRLEVVDIRNISDTASDIIRAQSGNHTVSSVGFSITRETLDDFLMPTSGSRFKFITDLAGMGGDIKYLRLEVQGGRWWPTFETMNQVFSVVARTGTITPWGGGQVPFYETYYLGGPNTLRGYDFRDVGPVDSSGEVIGGNTYTFASAEYSFQLLNPIRFATFYDFGYVNAADWDWNTQNFAHDVGFGFRILVMGAPLRLDLGYPLRLQNNQSRNWKFNFSFGTVF